MTTPSALQLADENRYLVDELNRVETILNSTRAEKDELSIRYNALSDRVSDHLFFFVSIEKSLGNAEEEKKIDQLLICQYFNFSSIYL